MLSRLRRSESGLKEARAEIADLKERAAKQLEASPADPEVSRVHSLCADVAVCVAVRVAAISGKSARVGRTAGQCTGVRERLLSSE